MMAVMRMLMAVLSAGPAIQMAVTGSGPPLGCAESAEHWYIVRWDETDYFDGDTIWVDSYPSGWSYLIRFAGVDTPELKAKDENDEPDEAERARAREAKGFTGDWLNERDGMVLLYVEDAGGKFGRPICWIYDFEANNLDNKLVEAGLIKHED